jgi:hypothetical protein
MVLVHWLDAFYEPGPMPASRFDGCPGMLLASAGLLVSNMRSGVAIALSYCEVSDEFRDVIFIPRPYIQSIRWLR